MITYFSDAIWLLTYGSLFVFGLMLICLHSILALIGCNGLKIGELQGSRKIGYTAFLLQFFGLYGDIGIVSSLMFIL